jgi:hypothetical protein
MTSKIAGTKITPPVSQARRRADGSWYVEVIWHNGRREQIGPYKTAQEANEFIKIQLQTWNGAPNGTRGDN